MKKFFVCIMVFILTAVGTTSALAASTEDSASIGGSYSVVSAVVNRDYDFKYDFHDSYLYDDDFYTEGIFKLDDYNGDVTITLKNNATGKSFVYEKEPQAEWSVKASVDHLLYETAQLDAAVHIYDLGGEYGIQEVDVPVKITVNSSRDSADFHKYPSYEGSHTAMYEGEDFSIAYDPSSDGKATITLLKKPWLFILSLYNVETGQLESFDPEDSTFEFPTEVEVTDYDPSRRSFWFYIPSKLIMDDGYEFHFTLSVNGFCKSGSTEDSVKPSSDSSDPSAANGDKGGVSSTYRTATPDSGSTSGTVRQNAGAVKTGETASAIILAVTVLITAAATALYTRKRKSLK